MDHTNGIVLLILQLPTKIATEITIALSTIKIGELIVFQILVNSFLRARFLVNKANIKKDF